VAYLKACIEGPEEKTETVSGLYLKWAPNQIPISH
jgi:hypothetical protein